MLSQEAAARRDIRQPLITPDPALPGRTLEERRTIAWVGKSVVFTGKLRSSEDMTIDGQVEGSIELRNHTLTIGPDADIHADIEARAVIILGGVTGTITASGKVDIREGGSVEGNIFSPSLVMADGAYLKGRVTKS